MIPAGLRRLGWIAAFAALLARSVKGVLSLDQLDPEDQPAQWPPLAFGREPAD